MNTKKIGWIGLGLMGNAMSRQVLEAGYPLTVYNRHKDKESVLKEMGAVTASTPKELLQLSEVVIIMVTDDRAVYDIFQGEDGLLASGAEEKVIINMSTVSPEISKEMARLSREHGLHYLDAPVSGSVKQAETAQLVIMVGGDEAVFARVEPVLNTMGKLSVHVGAAGAGNAAKLAINTLLGIFTQGLAEAVILAENNGIAPKALIGILGDTVLANPYIKLKGDAIVNNNFQAAFSLKNMVKDLRLSHNIRPGATLSKCALSTFESASDLFGDEDLIAVYKYLKDIK